MELPTTNPAQRRLVEELLGWGQPRPAVDHRWVADLRRRIEDAVADAVADAVDGTTLDSPLYLGKSALDALVCDGRYLDHIAGRFEWSAAALVGKLAHRAIDLDWACERTQPPAELVARAWEEFLRDDPGAAAFLAGLDPIEAAELRQQAEQLTLDFRDAWPPLSAAIRGLVHPRFERRIEVSLAGGRVRLSGVPDLLLGRADGGRCRMLVVDFKTGLPAEAQQRQELRFYALLVTLRYGVPPFRWAAFYVPEGRWDAEDLDPALLDSAAERVIDGVRRAVALRSGPATELRLVPGAYCRWCGRAPTCPAVG